MVDQQSCRACGVEFESAGRPEGLCPGCLLKLALPEFREANDTEIDRAPGPFTPTIGSYRLLRKVGEGGMGEVWEAEQREPVRRTVAVKLIKAGMDTRQVVARFESERQALAMMDHPCIARVYDAGETDSGRPYFVMEYVPGLPITEYCDTERLSMTERLKLFVQVCEGVQHAHHKGIIHRDIKPSNVMVQLMDCTPTPKIIDFGVAKAMQQRLTEKTLYTQLGVLVGTPAYMSPEQAAGTGLDIDTRTDVYSLGVLLYEMLVGVPPFDPQGLRAAGFDEIRRVIREEEPSRPSMRLSMLSGEESSASARRRQSAPRTLSRELRGDLDWITMCALEKDRGRRYGSPSDLAEDIRRHLRHEPILAGPPSATYRAGRFIRRHRLGVSAAALVILALVTGLGAAVYGLVEARRANRDAKQQAQTAEQVSEFLVDLFEVSDPSESRGNSITAREVLDRGVDRIREGLEDQPAQRSRMLGVMGRVYSNLGLLREAEQLTDQALMLEQQLPFTERLQRNTLRQLGWTRQQLGRNLEAEQAFLAAIEEERAYLGDDHPETARSMAMLGNLYRVTGRTDEAEDLLRKAVEILRETTGDEDEQTLIAKGNLGTVYSRQGRFEEALPLFEEAHAGMRSTFGEDHVNTLTTLRLTGYTLSNLGDYEKAERLLTKCADAQRRLLGPDHPRLQETLVNLAAVYRNTERYSEARQFYRESLRIAKLARGETHHAVFTSLNGLGETFLLEERYDEAEATLNESLTSGRAALGEHLVVGVAASRLAQVHKARGRLEAAETLLVEALEIFRNTEGTASDSTRKTLVELAALKTLRGDGEGALELLDEAVDLGIRPAGLVENPDFDTLRNDPRFLALVESADGSGANHD